MNESRFRNDEPVELEVWVHVDSGDALLVSLASDGSPHVWLPKMYVSIRCHGKQFSRSAYSAELTIPHWLARDRGLV